MQTDSNFDFDNLKISQLGFVYKDVRKQASLMEQFFGIPKFTVLGPLEMKILLRGKETKWTATGAFSQLFNGVEIELVQPESGESIHQEFLAQGREGLHHIRYNVDDLPAVINKFEKEGIEIIQSGKIIGLKYAYMNTEPLLGIIIEFSAVKKGRRRR
ncbi:MAG: VOC family protein [Promethearchaeota archaeon]|nr:MAG: VOC family protein [Candidatus Lokiarchaeota archaeon]